MSSGRKISLRSSDRESFEVDEAVALESQTIKQMIEDDCADNGIPLPNVTSKILAKVIEYCKKHVETPKLEDRGTNSGDYELQIWDYEFVKVDQATLFDLFMAASYLNIKGLLDLTGYAIADMIKRKTPEEIRKTFNCKGKLTPEEEEEVRRENQWPPWETDADMTPEAIRKTSNIKGKTPFNINDLTPEEEEEVRRENI
ncbi:hypothetical protein OIU77_019154 [Salix suchowensis]|uniref:SKP1-like protein n=1 Tax=Salix suchowensis TaxID=1278906 RepID=A0ABQ9CF64_9ROSI|nr:hypothetical protein OIU77_019154 [Salix suchowensis]